MPIDHVVAIYARENGQGMAFPVPTEGAKPTSADLDKPTPALRGLRLATSEPEDADKVGPAAGDDDPPDPGSPGAGRPSLKRVK